MTESGLLERLKFDYSYFSYICNLMLRNYSKIIHPIQSLKIGVIVSWKGARKSLCYVNELSVD